MNSKNNLVSDSFEVPHKMETDRFRLRMLSVDDVIADYDAVIESRTLLCSMFGGQWPREGFTIEENLSDLKRHQEEFLNREAFAYTVVELDESKVLGCLYIDPPNTTDYDAEIMMWVRQSEFDPGLDDILFSAVRKWIKITWPFKSVLYRGRNT